MLEIVVLETSRETHYSLNGVWCTQELNRLQLWIRNTVLEKIRINRRLALAMAFHHRLGRASKLGLLDNEVMLLVLAQC